MALNTKIQKENYPFSELAEEGANTLIFPDLASGNIAYKLLMELGGAEAIGPVLLGMKKPVHILQLGSSVRDIVNMAAIAVVDAQVVDREKDRMIAYLKGKLVVPRTLPTYLNRSQWNRVSLCEHFASDF